MVRIERATAVDLPALLEVDVLVTRADRQAEILRESVARGGCFVARADEGVVGFITWDRGFFSRPFVRLLAVAPGVRRRGLGRTLLDRVERDVPERELFVSTEALNMPMRALLASRGYLESGSINNLNPPGNLELVYYKRFE